MISTDNVIELHAQCLERHGGAPGLRDAQCPDRSLDMAQSYCYYASLSDDEQVVEDGLLLAASLCFYLCENHCFVDGNKRIAWAAAMKVLEQTLDLTINATDDEAEAFMLAIASRHEGSTVTIGKDEVVIEDAGDVVRWMSERLVASPHITRPH